MWFFQLGDDYYKDSFSIDRKVCCQGDQSHRVVIMFSWMLYRFFQTFIGILCSSSIEDGHIALIPSTTCSLVTRKKLYIF